MTLSGLPCNILLVFSAVPADTYWSFKYALRLIRRRTTLRALRRQSFSPYGLQYLCYLVRSLWKHPHLLAQTVKYGVVGHHFHVITREMLKYERTTSHLDRVCAQLKVILQAFEHNPDLVANGVEPIVAAWRWSATALAEAKAHIEKIHVDFRTDVVYHYETVTTRIRGLFAPFASELHRQGNRYATAIDIVRSPRAQGKRSCPRTPSWPPFAACLP